MKNDTNKKKSNYIICSGRFKETLLENYRKGCLILQLHQMKSEPVILRSIRNLSNKLNERSGKMDCFARQF